MRSTACLKDGEERTARARAFLLCTSTRMCEVEQHRYARLYHEEVDWFLPAAATVAVGAQGRHNPGGSIVPPPASCLHPRLESQLKKLRAWAQERENTRQSSLVLRTMTVYNLRNHILFSHPLDLASQQYNVHGR